ARKFRLPGLNRPLRINPDLARKVLNNSRRPEAVMSGQLPIDDLVQSFDYKSKLLGGYPSYFLLDPFHCKCSDLADLDPGSFYPFSILKLAGQGKPCPLSLDRQCHGNNSAGTFIENILTEDEYWSQPCLLPAAHRVQICPA